MKKNIIKGRWYQINKKITAKIDIKKIKEGFEVRLMYATKKFEPIMFFLDKRGLLGRFIPLLPN